MGDWKCPIDSIDEDIRDVVRILYENNMKPYMSCSGSYKDHKSSSYIPSSACVYMLDSSLTRELLAGLINNEKFKCTISKENASVFYDNELPEGLRFKIDFENINGYVAKELLQVLQSTIKGEKALSQDREKIDIVCDMLNDFRSSKGNDFGISFSFNDELVNPNSNVYDNFSIEIRDRKDLKKFKDTYGSELDSFVQDEYSSKFLSSDFITALAFLKKLKIDYKRIPYLNKHQHPQHVIDKERSDKFLFQHAQKIEEAKQRLEEQRNDFSFEGKPIDLFSFLTDESIDLSSLFDEGRNDR